MCDESRQKDTLEDLRNRVQIGDRPIISVDVCVQSGFFQQQCHERLLVSRNFPSLNDSVTSLAISETSVAAYVFMAEVGIWSVGDDLGGT